MAWAVVVAMGLALWTPRGSLGAQAVPDSSSQAIAPSQVIVLADWGVSDASEIGYLHVGVLHRADGDALAIYSVRQRPPVIQWPSEPQHRTPPLDGGVFLLGHFDRGNTNRLGGYFNGFAQAPSTSALAIARAPDDGPALAYSYDKEAGSFAGFWIHLFDFKQPPTERVLFDAGPLAYLTFAIRGELGGEDLALHIADRAWEEREGSLPIADVASFLTGGRIETTWQRVWVPLDELPPGLNTQELASLVFLTNGEGAGRVFLKDIAFTTNRDAEIPTAVGGEEPGRSLRQAMWVWETPAVTSSPDARRRLVQFCRTQGITDLFVQLPYQARRVEERWTISWDRDRLRPLIADLHAAGVTVHALDGDPRFGLTEWHGQVIATIQSIVEYNRESPPAQRFDGIRHDIEPYLLPGFGGVRRPEILEQYLTIVAASRALAAQAGLVYGVDIPAWFDERNEFFEPVADVEGRPLSELIIDIVDNVGIMDYRTQAYGADGTIAHAQSELRYAAAAGKRVFVGLETVDLPDETDFTFSSEGSGGSRIVIEQIDAASPGLFGAVATSPATAPSAVTLTLIGELDPPVVDGQAVQATSVSARWQFSFLVSYNTGGEPFAGAVDYVINAAGGTAPRLASSVAFTDSDISAVGLDGFSIYAAQATDASGFATPAALERLRLSFFRIQLEDNARFDLTSFAATSVLAVGNEIYVTTGDDGHLYALNESDLSTVGQFALEDARWVAHDADNGRIVVVQGTPGRISLFQEGDFPGGSMTLLNTFPFPGADVAHSKSSVEIVGGKAFIAAGPDGVQVMCLDDGQIVGSVPPPDAAALGPSVVVTNAVTVDGDLMFISNGEAGVYAAAGAADFASTPCNAPQTITVLGHLRFEDLTSVNHVDYENDKLLIAAGRGGLKIVRVDITP